MMLSLAAMMMIVLVGNSGDDDLSGDAVAMTPFMVAMVMI